VNAGFQDVFSTGVHALQQSFPSQTLAADLDVIWGGHLDPESVVYLGGSDGLRGYPNHFRIGDRRWMISAEDRFLTDWNSGGSSKPASWSTRRGRDPLLRPATGAHLRDVGGAAVGNLKSAFGRVLLLTLAFPSSRNGR